MKTKIYIDMDGCIAKWNTEAFIDDTFLPGYFANREPDVDLINTVKDLVAAGYDITILTAVYIDDHSKQDKLKWLKKYGLDNLNIIFVPYGNEKSKYIEMDGNISILLDDFSRNLNEWILYPNCYGIKYMNGINGTKGTWKSFMVSNKMNQVSMFRTIRAIINEIAAEVTAA